MPEQYVARRQPTLLVLGAGRSSLVNQDGSIKTGRSRRVNQDGSIKSEVLAELRDVARCLDVVLRPLDGAVLVDHERRADDAGDGLAVELLLAIDAVGVERLPGRVAQEGEVDVLLVPEARLLLRAVR